MPWCLEISVASPPEGFICFSLVFITLTCLKHTSQVCVETVAGCGLTWCFLLVVLPHIILLGINMACCYWGWERWPSGQVVSPEPLLESYLTHLSMLSRYPSTVDTKDTALTTKSIRSLLNKIWGTVISKDMFDCGNKRQVLLSYIITPEDMR